MNRWYECKGTGDFTEDPRLDDMYDDEDAEEWTADDEMEAARSRAENFA